MKRFFILAAALLIVTGCTVTSRSRSSESPYANPFYARYLNTGSTLDAQISETLQALQQNPDSPELHNTLGSLLVEKGFPKDAEREFERAINLDSRYYPAWYNLGLVRASRGDDLGSKRALGRTLDVKPGHDLALFQLGLIEEKAGHRDRAVALYAKAFAINPALLEVDVNPRILDTKLTHLALLRLYENDHARKSMEFEGASAGLPPQAQEAPSPEPAPQTIVPPAAPVTDPARQPAVAPAPPPAEPEYEEGVIGGSRRPRREKPPEPQKPPR